jgi:hypothetical protein
MQKPFIFPFPSTKEFVTVLVVAADPGTTATVYRQYGSGKPEIVRGAKSVPVKNPETLVIDHEVPQGYEITYWVTSTAGSVTLESVHKKVGPYNFGRDVLFDLADPRQGMLVYVESFQAYKYGISRDVQRVWGRSDPVVISGVREMLSGTLDLITLSLAERTNILEIIQNGSTVAFAPQYPAYGLEGVMYFAVGDVIEERTSPKAIEDSRRWRLDVQQITAPPAEYKYPSYGKTWREFREEPWSDYAMTQWWEAIA